MIYLTCMRAKNAVQTDCEISSPSCQPDPLPTEMVGMFVLQLMLSHMISISVHNQRQLFFFFVPFKRGAHFATLVIPAVATDMVDIFLDDVRRWESWMCTCVYMTHAALQACILPGALFAAGTYLTNAALAAGGGGLSAPGTRRSKRPNRSRRPVWSAFLLSSSSSGAGAAPASTAPPSARRAMGSALAVAILAGGAALSAAGAPNRVGGSGGDGGGAATGAGAGALAATVDATLLGGLVLARRAVGVFSRPPPSAPPALPRPPPSPWPSAASRPTRRYPLPSCAPWTWPAMRLWASPSGRSWPTRVPLWPVPWRRAVRRQTPGIRGRRRAVLAGAVLSWQGRTATRPVRGVLW